MGWPVDGGCAKGWMYSAECCHGAARDLVADGQGGSSCGARCIHHVHGARGLHPKEVVHEVSGGEDGLGSHAGPSSHEVVGAHFGHEAL